MHVFRCTYLYRHTVVWFSAVLRRRSALNVLTSRAEVNPLISLPQLLLFEKEEW